MIKSVLTFLPVLGTILLLSVFTSTSYADVPCPGKMAVLGENPTISGGTTTLFNGEAILGDVFVTNGATLIMNAGSCVGKNVFLEDGAKLIMKGNTFGAIVEGSVFVKSDGSGPAESVTMNDNSRVSGDLLVEAKGGAVHVTIDGKTKTASIGGDILIKESTGNLILIDFSVSGDVNVEGVEDVTIDGTGSGVVRGDISINGANGAISITETNVTGDVRMKEPGGSISITETDVGGDVSVEGKETAVAGFLKVNDNRVTGDIQLKNSRMTLIEVNNNTILGGSILMEGGVTSSGNIEVKLNGDGTGTPNPSEIQMKGNDAKMDLVVKTNGITENLLMESNIAGRDLIVDDNEFISGLLIAKENEADNISVSGNGPAPSRLEILQLEKNSADTNFDVNDNRVFAFGKFEIKENTSSNLNCSGNSLVPEGSGNTGTGTPPDQCAGLG